MMPNFSGIDFYESLARARPDNARRVVFMSGGAFTARARAFLASIENVHLQKPVDAARLRAIVAGLST